MINGVGRGTDLGLGLSPGPLFGVLIFGSCFFLPLGHAVEVSGVILGILQ